MSDNDHWDEIWRLLRRGYWCLPVFWFRGARWRVRARFVRNWRLCRVIESFPEGLVLTWRVGPLLVVAMVDDGGKS